MQFTVLNSVTSSPTEVKEAAIFYYTGSQVSAHALYNFETGTEIHTSNITGSYISNSGRTVKAVASGEFGYIRAGSNAAPVTAQGHYDAGDTIFTIAGGANAVWYLG